jgi:hypothetical protein
MAESVGGECSVLAVLWVSLGSWSSGCESVACCRHARPATPCSSTVGSHTPLTVIGSVLAAESQQRRARPATCAVRLVYAASLSSFTHSPSCIRTVME